MSKKLKILYITQKLDYNDDLLGAIHSYISSLASMVEKIYVLCLYRGESRLPENCEVFSLGKEKGESNIKYVINFYKYVLPLIFKKKINGVFIHMNQIYVYLLLPLRPLMKLFNIPLLWWKAHAKLNFRSRWPRFFVDRILTSVSMGYNINTPKRRIVGQGIDTDKFRPMGKVSDDNKTVNIAVIGRLSPVRKYDLLLRAIKKVKDDLPGIKLKVKVYGQLAYENQQSYYDNIKELQSDYGLNEIVSFEGSVPNHQLPELINQSDFIVNPGGSNSLDKAIVEAMACEKIIVDSNAATSEILKKSDLTEQEKEIFLFKRHDWQDMAEKIKNVINLDNDKKASIEKKLRQLVVSNHNVDHLSQQIIKIFNEVL